MAGLGIDSCGGDRIQSGTQPVASTCVWKQDFFFQKKLPEHGVFFLFFSFSFSISCLVLALRELKNIDGWIARSRALLAATTPHTFIIIYVFEQR
jgi:hypothetical protein